MNNQSCFIIQLPEYGLLLIITIIVLVLALICYLFLQLAHHKAKTKKLTASNNFFEQKLNNVQLDYIGTKLNPHLFKNILNSVQSHAYQNFTSLEKLSNVLDYILYESNNKFVSPKEELEFTMSHIEINKIKINPLFDFRIKNNINEHDDLYEEKIIAPLITVLF